MFSNPFAFVTDIVFFAHPPPAYLYVSEKHLWIFLRKYFCVREESSKGRRCLRFAFLEAKDKTIFLRQIKEFSYANLILLWKSFLLRKSSEVFEGLETQNPFSKKKGQKASNCFVQDGMKHGMSFGENVKQRCGNKFSQFRRLLNSFKQ